MAASRPNFEHSQENGSALGRNGMFLFQYYWETALFPQLRALRKENGNFSVHCS